MEKREKVIQLIFLFLLVLLVIAAKVGIGVGEDRGQIDEKEKLFSIAQNMEFIKKPYIKQDEGFCRSFLDALKAREGVEFIEPIIRADDYNDSGLQSYLSRCPKLQLNKSVAFEPRIWDYAKTLPEEERESLGRVSFINLDFRLYHVDVDNNPENGKEYLFYGGGRYYPKKNTIGTFTDFIIVDFNRCEDKGRAQVFDTFNYFTKKPKGNHNFVIRFREKSYILELIYYPNENKYYIRLYEFKFFKGIKKFSSSPVCYYDPIKPEKGGVQK